MRVYLTIPSFWLICTAGLAVLAGFQAQTTLGYEYIHTLQSELVDPPDANGGDFDAGPGWYISYGWSELGDANATNNGYETTLTCEARVEAGGAVVNLQVMPTAERYTAVWGKEWWTWNGPPGSEPPGLSVNYSYRKTSALTNVYGGGRLGGPGCDGATYSDTTANANLGFTWWHPEHEYCHPVGGVDVWANATGAGYLGSTAYGWGDASVDPFLDGDSVDVPPMSVDEGGYSYGTSAGTASHEGSFLVAVGATRLEARYSVSCDAFTQVWVSSSQGYMTSANTIGILASATLTSSLTVESR